MSIKKCWAALALCAAASLSCTVKEDREMCPCVLSVDLSSCHSMSGPINVSVCAGDRTIAGSFIPGEDPSVHDFEVPKGPCILYAVSGGIPDKEGTLHVPYGEQCAEYYVFAASFTAAGEAARQEVFLHKEYAAISLDLRGSRWADPQYRFTLEGNSCGVDVIESIPLPGAFSFDIPDSGTAIRYARVPRQADTSLVLKVYAGTTPAAEFKIGEMIEESGYDWTQQDLKDITVKVPDSVYGVTVSISDWLPEQVPSVVI